MRQFLTRSQRETAKLAKTLAQEIIKKPLKIGKALIIGLEGELGSGKTTFIKGFAKGLGIKRRLTSPTFVLLKKYKIPKNPNIYLYHLDCYRLNRTKDLLGLDFPEIISNPQNIIIIEWAERVRSILPKSIIWIKFEIISEKERRIIIRN